MTQRSKEANDVVNDLNARVDELKRLNDKDMATGFRIAADIMDRINAVNASDNPQFLAVSGKMFSVVNRLMALGGQTIPQEQIRNLANQQAALRNQIQIGLNDAQANGKFISPEDRIIAQDALRSLNTSLVETSLLTFKGTPKDFFENPQYQQLAQSAVNNYMGINPEQTAMIKKLVQAYATANNQNVPPDFKLEPSNFRGHAGFNILTAQGQRTGHGVYVD